ncbi:hypothetical protein T4E_9910 [Trichinella pseudospiralis]|uniref:Uncharacterized protein n=1 Tax=Trichinella pseudospiralis TaxID=6337 RepID=A0A0V0YMT9_TRIPS|nr:hypothetical protein T4E_9910 [Trichinella pseudospiralis]
MPQKNVQDFLQFTASIGGMLKKHLRKLPHLLGLPFDILEFHSLTSGKTRVVIGQRWSNRKDTARYAIGLYSFIV